MKTDLSLPSDDLSDAQKVAEIADRFGLTPQPARLLLILMASPERILADDTIASRIRDLSSEYPTKSAIVSAVKHARRALRSTGWRIETITSIGYKLTVRTGGPGDLGDKHRRSRVSRQPARLIAVSTLPATTPQGNPT